MYYTIDARYMPPRETMLRHMPIKTYKLQARSDDNQACARGTASDLIIPAPDRWMNEHCSIVSDYFKAGCPIIFADENLTEPLVVDPNEVMTTVKQADRTLLIADLKANGGAQAVAEALARARSRSNNGSNASGSSQSLQQMEEQALDALLPSGHAFGHKYYYLYTQNNTVATHCSDADSVDTPGKGLVALVDSSESF